MGLTPGTRLGPYEIQSPLGAGGMGEVYRARDTKLGREVAIKVLPEAFAQDADRLARFEREAKTLASLNHPNIAIIHGLEQSGDVHALVMELVEGEDLSQRIARGAISIDEALPIARQIAEALEAAHEQGIIHRDLKPANIKVRPDGTVKVLDFGLAKAMEPASALHGSGGHALSQAPTITTPAMTQAGMILGTAAYMSPEQASGKPVDRRGDLWAFGVVLHEMLTGRRLFDGETVSHVLAAVLTKEPDWTALPATTPASIRRLLRRCLEKDRKRRMPDAAAARLEIEDALGGADTPVAVVGQASIDEAVATARAQVWRAMRVRMAVVAASLLAAVTLAVYALRVTGERAADDSAGNASLTRSIIDIAPAEQLLSAAALDRGRPSRTAVALSPDGRTLIFSGRLGDRVQLFKRQLDALEATPIEGTEGGDTPFFSPDGRWIGFWAAAEGRCIQASCEGALKKIPAGGGTAVQVASSGSQARGASWGDDDMIVFSRQGSLMQVPASGGEPTQFAAPGDGEFAYLDPHVLPNGGGVLFTVQKAQGRWDNAQVVLQSPRGSTRKVLVEGGADGRYAPSGHLLFARLGTLMAIPFDIRRLEVTGSAVGLVPDVMQAVNVTAGSTDTGAAQFSVSNDGTLVYVAGGVYPALRGTVEWVARDGSRQALLAETTVTNVRLSPDGKRAAGLDLQARKAWLIDLIRGGASLLTAGASVNGAIWSPDGKQLAIADSSLGPQNIFVGAADGSTRFEQVTTGGGNKWPMSWTPDGSILLFVAEDPAGNDIWAYSTVDQTTRPVIAGPGNQRWAELSPDGHWLAYTSNESGRDEVYVQPFPGLGERHQVSTGGGGQPVWAHSGRELFYLRDPQAPQGTRTQMFNVVITTSPTFSVSAPRPLFETPVPGGNPYRGYDISADDRRFLMGRRLDESLPAPARQIVLVQRWTEELKRLAPAN